jgi:hypothetical protein
VNIFINYITNPKIHITNIIGTDVQFKYFVLHHDDYFYDLHFLDLKSFLAEGNLDKYTSKFAIKSDSEPPKQKGIFPYEFLNDENYFEELSKFDLFKFEDFNFTLKDSNISVDKTRLEYLEWYNTQDVIIMCPIIDFLMNKFEENNIDMLRNISLSSCADQVKFAMAYKNFNFKEDYSKQIKTTFELTKDYFQRKISDYDEQDKKAKRKITKNITMNDYEYFKELFKNSKCYLCNEGFTKK